MNISPDHNQRTGGNQTPKESHNRKETLYQMLMYQGRYDKVGDVSSICELHTLQLMLKRISLQ